MDAVALALMGIGLVAAAFAALAGALTHRMYEGLYVNGRVRYVRALAAAAAACAGGAGASEALALSSYAGASWPASRWFYCTGRRSAPRATWPAPAGWSSSPWQAPARSSNARRGRLPPSARVEDACLRASRTPGRGCFPPKRPLEVELVRRKLEELFEGEGGGECA